MCNEFDNYSMFLGIFLLFFHNCRADKMISSSISLFSDVLILFYLSCYS